MTKHLPQLFSSVLRVSALGLRFVLMFSLARHLPLSDFGLFGLYSAGLLLAAAVLPLDIYSNSTRLLLQQDADVGGILSRHSGFLLLSSILLVPIAAMLFSLSIEKVTMILSLIFLIHLPFELFSTDMGRLMVALGKPLQANIALFLRTASWIIPVVVILEFDIVEIALTQILWIWLAGSVLTLLYSLAIYARMPGVRVRPVVDFKWIAGSIAGSGLFLLATFLFRSVLGLDRFMVENALGLEIVGIYSLFASVALGVLGIIEAGVSAWRFPALVKNIADGEYAAARKQFWLFVRQNSLATIALILAIAAVFTPAMYFLLDPPFFENWPSFLTILAGVALYCLSMPAHYLIFGFRKDAYLVGIYAFALVVMLLWALIYLKSGGLPAAATMLSLALTSIAVSRCIAASVLLKRK